MARKAAKQSLQINFPPPAPPVGLEWLSGPTLYSLLQYREDCEEAVRDDANEDEFWFDLMIEDETEDLLKFECKICDAGEWSSGRARTIVVQAPMYCCLVPQLLGDTPC
ncbi:hypothetical protein CERSUDRAFT_93326 [Gelatoporia subvermispora B]|uniref:Uncharacterized protein n=1 Tax=Ceriporiopsis subvermispora (strain B) TaxID=914234 RepID=M2RKC0_CERS8|nr:hypothetical protein CERSUDRAFT_93326 [Gelatoporia subvermispora B]